MALSAYAEGLFPMDDPAEQERPLPFYTADPRTILDIDPDGLARLRRKVRRSLACDPGWEAAVDRDFAAVLAGCAAPRREEGVWLTPRLESLYEQMHAMGFAHSWELWDGGDLVAGVLGVGMRRAAMLESMFHTRPHAGNVGLLRTAERIAADGYELCDLQLPTPHTTRLGARPVPAAEYERLLDDALREKVRPTSL
jgi:leucyl/phenylalanyl-tRNA--protein transferase